MKAHMTDKRLISKKNQESILFLLNRFGWLTIPMIAKLVWPTSSQASALARRTIKKLIEAKFLVKRHLNSKIDCFTLSSLGAKYLKENLGIAAESGAKLKLANYIHRACGNWFLIDCILSGREVWTEYEIYTGRSPLNMQLGKIPDAMIKGNNGILWVEIENSWKNTIERQKIVSFCANYLESENNKMKSIGENIHLERLLIIGATRDSLRYIFNTFKDNYKNGKIEEKYLHDIDMVYVSLTDELNFNHKVYGNMWHDAIEPSIFNENT